MNALDTIRSVELEITGTCDLQCAHCCTMSGPKVSSGLMTRDNWDEVITDIAALSIPAVQMIGGEPTLSPHLPHYIERATKLGLFVEVYSNLTHIRPALWRALDHPRVALATSYYSDQAEQHERITQGKGSHGRTRANILEALDRNIPLRVGIVEVNPGQRIAEAEAELRALGVKRVDVDRARKVGRAATGTIPTVDELCGHCFRHRVSIDPDGNVSGCILSRFLEAGNVRERPLHEILHDALWSEITATIPTPRSACTPEDSAGCNPGDTNPCTPVTGHTATAVGCTPDDSSDCDPSNTPACNPAYTTPAAPLSLEAIA
ncbi:radical SAM protein [Streptomyces sp. BA2]|uniref:radical SAM protein n=1 Tax=Streptomyces sp. BA2 TaxID=436595 RepID=UPI0013241860|nr:radical SAM protein [Streptomyces sp. BA2]MWA12560.1 radical SAM protein [Streptomyces sp. BA2]